MLIASELALELTVARSTYLAANVCGKRLEKRPYLTPKFPMLSAKISINRVTILEFCNCNV